jgi:hypothetical protein
MIITIVPLMNAVLNLVVNTPMSFVLLFLARLLLVMYLMDVNMLLLNAMMITLALLILVTVKPILVFSITFPVTITILVLMTCVTGVFATTMIESVMMENPVPMTLAMKILVLVFLPL